MILVSTHFSVIFLVRNVIFAGVHEHNSQYLVWPPLESHTAWIRVWATAVRPRFLKAIAQSLIADPVVMAEEPVQQSL